MTTVLSTTERIIFGMDREIDFIDTEIDLKRTEIVLARTELDLVKTEIDHIRTKRTKRIKAEEGKVPPKKKIKLSSHEVKPTDLNKTKNPLQSKKNGPPEEIKVPDDESDEVSDLDDELKEFIMLAGVSLGNVKLIGG